MIYETKTRGNEQSLGVWDWNSETTIWSAIFLQILCKYMSWGEIGWSRCKLPESCSQSIRKNKRFKKKVHSQQKQKQTNPASFVGCIQFKARSGYLPQWMGQGMLLSQDIGYHSAVWGMKQPHIIPFQQKQNKETSGKNLSSMEWLIFIHSHDGSMGLVHLPTFTIQINHSWIGKYTVRPMDPMGLPKKAPLARLMPKTSTACLSRKDSGANPKINALYRE